MEYVRGVDLSRAIKEQGGLQEDQIRLIMAQVGLALNHLHRKGFIHRDIKVRMMHTESTSAFRLPGFDLRVNKGVGFGLTAHF